MTDRSKNPNWVVTLLRIQQIVSVLFLMGAVAFPFYTFYRHGLDVLPVYDAGGNIASHASYFLLSLGCSAFAAILGLICYRAARNALQQLRGGK